MNPCLSMISRGHGLSVNSSEPRPDKKSVIPQLCTLGQQDHQLKANLQITHAIKIDSTSAKSFKFCVSGEKSFHISLKS